MTAPPFTAEQIRDATPAGKRIRFRNKAADTPVKFTEIRFVAVDKENATFERHTLDAEGKSASMDGTSTESWASLRDHAAFPAEYTTQSLSEVNVPFGSFPALHYLVEDPEKDSETRYWFSRQHPGPPLKVEVLSRGKRVFLMEMLPQP